MKPIRILWCLAAAALVVGCQDNPTDPTAQADEVTAPSFKAEHVDFLRNRRDWFERRAELLAAVQPPLRSAPNPAV